MSTITLTLTLEIAKLVSDLSRITNKSEADIFLEALSFYFEEQAVQNVLNTAKEPTVDANL